ncbi:hypothetical protein PEPS_34390 (plasmid) [Persicobacter psychrovividus]|uniref:Uncharacterized protein n=1 Tax=Persicobacter psychrovividus TaxID=387638 RepID=A0ABN6LDC8_9BACT|nr:hypothetical protein PEPS_34390 [Persicobacter psychrovividus]
MNHKLLIYLSYKAKENLLKSTHQIFFKFALKGFQAALSIQQFRTLVL